MMFNADERKNGSARRFCCEKLSDVVNAYTLEISMCGYQLNNCSIAQYTEDDCKFRSIAIFSIIVLIVTFHLLKFVDMRFGRNIARSLLQYYRFTNVLSIPLIGDLKSKKQRPKTHRSRSRVRQSHIIKPRPKSTRAYAPISYNDLELLRDNSSTSNECSPTRSGFGSRLNKNIYLDITSIPDNYKPDQYSLLSIQASKFKHLDFNDSKGMKTKTTIDSEKINIANNSDEILVNVPPKPSLSIIDFNQLTRGGLEQAKRSLQKLGRSNDGYR